MSPEDMVLLQQLVQMGYPPELALQVVQAQSQLTGGMQNPGIAPPTAPPASMAGNSENFGDPFGAGTYGFGFDGDPDSRYYEDGSSTPGYEGRQRMAESVTPQVQVGAPSAFAQGRGTFAGFLDNARNGDDDKQRSMARPDKPRDVAMVASDLMRGAQKALPEQAAAPAQRNAFGNNPKAVENRASRPQPKPRVNRNTSSPAKKKPVTGGGGSPNRY